MSLFRTIFLCGLFVVCGVHATSASTTDASAAQPSAIDTYVTVLGQQIVSLNDKIASKKSDIEKLKTRLASLDKSSDQYPPAQVNLDKANEELVLLNDQLIKSTAEKNAQAAVAGFINDVQQGDDDAADVGVLLGTDADSSDGEASVTKS